LPVGKLYHIVREFLKLNADIAIYSNEYLESYARELAREIAEPEREKSKNNETIIDKLREAIKKSPKSLTVWFDTYSLAGSRDGQYFRKPRIINNVIINADGKTACNLERISGFRVWDK